MPSGVLELRPDRKLINPNFEGYKLNLQSIPHWEHKLQNCLHRSYPDDGQYSYLHARLFSLHNHLFNDIWNHYYIFYCINSDLSIRRIHFSSDDYQTKENEVFKLPFNSDEATGRFNPSISFPSANYAFVSDGAGQLYMLSADARSTFNMWELLYSEEVLGHGKFFTILDSREDSSSNRNQLNCLLYSIQLSDHIHYSILSWVVLTKTDENWHINSIRQLKGKGVVHYASIETSCNALYIASDEEFKFIADSDNEIKILQEPVKVETYYSWLQTSDDITISLQLTAAFQKEHLHITNGLENIKVSYAGKTFLEGKLTNKIDNELTTWNLDSNGKLDVLLTKSESNIWEELLEGGDPHGEQVLDPALVEEVHKKLAHLCSESEVIADSEKPAFNSQELEECDTVSEDTVLARLEVNGHTRTHRVPLSVHQYLFSIKVDPHEVPALALRYDVDACIWQPYAKLFNNEAWPVKHLGTLPAFGYIQSSKQNRKFVTCPPNFEYSVVCEANKHLLIYNANGSSGCELRKRSCGGDSVKVSVGQQFVFNLDKYGEVMGVHATNKYLFLLTESILVILEVNL